jgi:hypothetical protein
MVIVESHVLHACGVRIRFKATQGQLFWVEIPVVPACSGGMRENYRFKAPVTPESIRTLRRKFPHSS